MSNSLHYVAAQVAPYLVDVTRRLRQVSSDSVELASATSVRDELKEKVLGLEGEKCKFKERYELLVGEKAFVEEQVAILDGSSEHFFQRIEALVEEKKVLESRVEEKHGDLEVEMLRRKVVEDDIM